MSDWRSIDTAPIDGTEVLLYNPRWGGGMSTMRGYNIDGEWHASKKIMTLGRSVEAEDPTHWQPLPKSDQK